MDALIVLPIVAPLVLAAGIFAWGGNATRSTAIALIGPVIVLATGAVLLGANYANGIQVSHMGSWPAPYGISLVADYLSSIMLILTGAVGLAALTYILISGEYIGRTMPTAMNAMLGGISGAFLTGDLFNLFVWFEVLLISSFVLLVIGGRLPQLEGGIKYVTLNLIGSTLFLTAAGVTYGTLGTLNLADIGRVLAEGGGGTHAFIITVLLFTAFGIKAAVFPLFFWLPASYHTPGHGVAAAFSGLLTKVGVYAMLRIGSVMFPAIDPVFLDGLVVVAGLTMFVGVIGAYVQTEFRRILSFHIISQVGYMVLGIAIFTELAVTGAVFYITHHIIVKTGLFLVAGAVQQQTGTNDLYRLGGLFRNAPLTAVTFGVLAASLAGFPPSSGFFAKLTLVQAGIESGHYVVTGVALLVSLLTVMSMTKIWNEVFWKGSPNTSASGIRRTARRRYLLPAAILAVVAIAIAAFAGPVGSLAQATAQQLMDPEAYRSAVLGGE